MENEFSVRDTNIAKGIALCLMLVHHLFYKDYIYVSDIYIYGHQICNTLSYYSKVCLAMFVILSGYGLNEVTKRNKISIKNFYKNYLLKLYLNYWVIWVIFLPVGVIVFGRSLIQVYGNNHILIKMIINMLGLQVFFGFDGYNPTWWFMSIIIPLYIVFPFLKTLIYKYKEYMLLICFLLMFTNISLWRLNLSAVLDDSILPFALGIYLSMNNCFVYIKNFKFRVKYLKTLLYLLILLFIIYWRRFGIIVSGTKIDSVFGFLIIIIGYEYLSKGNVLYTFLMFIGKHSSNIFLFHTFIFLYFFHDFIYWFKYPIIIFFVLLFICLGISMIIERIKDVLLVNKFYNKIKNIKLKDSIII